MPPCGTLLHEITPISEKNKGDWRGLEDKKTLRCPCSSPLRLLSAHRTERRPSCLRPSHAKWIPCGHGTYAVLSENTPPSLPAELQRFAPFPNQLEFHPSAFVRSRDISLHIDVLQSLSLWLPAVRSRTLNKRLKRTITNKRCYKPRDYCF